MHVQPAVAGQHEHNMKLTKHAENQQHYIQHLESVLGQTQVQMGRLQNGYEQLRSEMQNEVAKSENLFKQEAGQLMEMEQEREHGRLKYVRELSNLRKDKVVITSPLVNLNQSSEFYTPRGKYDPEPPSRHIVGGNSEQSEKGKTEATPPKANVARGDPTPSAKTGRDKVEETVPDWAKINQMVGREANFVKFEAFPTAPKFRAWKRNFLKKVASSSGDPQKAFMWISEVDEKSTHEDLANSNGFETLDAKIASGLGKSCKGNFKGK